MSKIAATVTTIIALTEAAYQPQHQATTAHPEYGYGHGPVFNKPSALIDPAYPQSLLLKFQKCKEDKCDVLSREYSYDVTESISVLGAYTSCITACAAEQTLRATVDTKNALAKYSDIGFAQLVLARKYLSGEGDYDVLGEATTIKDSCCLPNEYFTTWDRVMVPAVLVASGINANFGLDGPDGTSGSPIPKVARYISVTTYVNVCTTAGAEKGWLQYAKIECVESVLEYLELLQRNVGHLVLAPSSVKSAPNGACNSGLQKNPRAATFPKPVCVATECKINGKSVPVEEPLIKDIIPAYNHWETCPSDIGERDINSVTTPFEIYYKRVETSELKYYTVTGGLPSLVDSHTSEDLAAALLSGDISTLGKCTFEEAITPAGQLNDPTHEVTDMDAWGAAFSIDAVNAARVCPFGGLFEYCNMRQYASFLQRQLFNTDQCQVVDMRNVEADQQEYYGTLSCLYKVTTLKCDCMEAVLNCYENKWQDAEPLSHTIGKAASILCGFLLCQRPRVYSLFGGQTAIEKSVIMRELLSKAGAAVSGTQGMPPATFAFLTFGVGMLAFLATKSFAKTSKAVSSEDGYRSLI